MVLSFPNHPSAMPLTISDQLNQLIAITLQSQANFNNQLAVLIKITENLNSKVDTLTKNTGTLANHITNLSSHNSAESSHSSGTETPPTVQPKPPVKTTLPPPLSFPARPPPLIPVPPPLIPVPPPSLPYQKPPPWSTPSANDPSHMIFKSVMGTPSPPQVQSTTHQNEFFHAFCLYGRYIQPHYKYQSDACYGSASPILSLKGPLLPVLSEGVVGISEWRPQWRVVESAPIGMRRVDGNYHGGLFQSDCLGTKQMGTSIATLFRS